MNTHNFCMLIKSFFKALIRVIGQFEKLMRGFLWGNQEGRHRIAWESVCKSADVGGLGLGIFFFRTR